MNTTITNTTTTTNPTITAAQLLGALNWRYATKKFDPAKKIPAGTWAALEQALVLAPSSLGLQPWKFIIVTDPALKQKLSAASHDQPQPADASHLVVFALRQTLDATCVDKHIDRVVEIRGVARDSLARFRQFALDHIAHHANAAAAPSDKYTSEQCHIALGQFMAAAALLGVDTCALGAIDNARYDELLALNGTGYRTVMACAAGHRAGDDPNAALPKVRFENKDVLAHI
jgi:nitroreductase